MNTRNVLAMLILASQLLAGCDDPPDRGPRPTLEGDDPDAGTGSNSAPRYAVISSDFTATAVSLLDGKGSVLADDYIDSAAAPAGLTTALSGDVGLPTRSGERGVLVLLDRFKTDVITRIDLSSGDVLGQVKLDTFPEADSESTYTSNVQDYVQIDSHTAWISRYEPNLDPDVAALDRGTDLLRIDPSSHERTGDRIDLSGLNTEVVDPNAETSAGERTTVYARPSRMVRVGDTLVVGLARLSFDFMVASDGAVALVDVKTKQVRAFELPGLQSCSDVVPVAGAADEVIVGCGGHFGGDAQAGSGLVLLRVREGKAERIGQWLGKDHLDAPRMVLAPVSLGGTRVAAFAVGQSAIPAGAQGAAVAGRPDRYGVIDLETGEQQLLFESDDAYALGGGSFDPDTGLLLVPDASTDDDTRPTAGVRRFKVNSQDEDQDIEELDPVKVTEDLALPVRQIAVL